MRSKVTVLREFQKLPTGLLPEHPEHRAPRHRLTDECLARDVAAAAGAKDAVEADQRDYPLAADIDGIVEPFQLDDVERCGDDAGERSVGREQPPRQLNRRLAGQLADGRLADVELVGGGADVNPKRLAVADVDDGGDRARVAVREHARAVGDERRPELADSPAHRPIFFEDFGGFVSQRAPHVARVVTIPQAGVHRAIQRPRQVHGRGTCTTKASVGVGKNDRQVAARPRWNRQRQPHRRGDADRRGAPHRQRVDRLADLVHRPQHAITSRSGRRRWSRMRTPSPSSDHVTAWIGCMVQKRRFVVRPA